MNDFVFFFFIVNLGSLGSRNGGFLLLALFVCLLFFVILSIVVVFSPFFFFLCLVSLRFSAFCEAKTACCKMSLLLTRMVCALFLFFIFQTVASNLHIHESNAFIHQPIHPSIYTFKLLHTTTNKHFCIFLPLVCNIQRKSKTCNTQSTY